MSKTMEGGGKKIVSVRDPPHSRIATKGFKDYTVVV